LPAEIEAVCAKALTRDPDKRFATAAEFADALEHVAKSFDLIGTKREVSACVDEILASDLAERRAAVKAWLVEADPTRTPPPSSNLADVGGTVAGTAIPAVENSAARVRPSNRALSWGAAALAAGLAAAIGLVEREQLRAASLTPTPSAELTTTSAPQGSLQPEPVPPPATTSAGTSGVAPMTTAIESNAAPASEPPQLAPVATATAIAGPSATRSAPSVSSTPLVAIRPARPVGPPTHVTAPVTGAARSAPPSLPQDMVVNPYR
jgi:serine/threonine-protein kinase